MELKEKRSISGIYFNYYNNKLKRKEKRCFEDLPEEDQDLILSNKSPEYLIKLVKGFSQRIREIGDKFDLVIVSPMDEADIPANDYN